MVSAPEAGQPTSRGSPSTTAPYVGQPVRDVPLPHDSALVAILRGKRVLVPTPDDPLEAGDELIFVCTTEVEDAVRAVVLGDARDAG